MANDSELIETPLQGKTSLSLRDGSRRDQRETATGSPEVRGPERPPARSLRLGERGAPTNWHEGAAAPRREAPLVPQG